jgi:hypothetical protein
MVVTKATFEFVTKAPSSLFNWVIMWVVKFARKISRDLPILQLV